MAEFEPGGHVGQLLGERYELTEYVESGAMGEIYRATDHRLEYRQVAVKLLKPGMPEDQVSRFRREALLTGGLSSPHVVKTSDFGALPEGRVYLVMEWLKGETVAALLGRKKRLPAKRAVRIIDGILAGLEAAHNSGVVHRDLKPENVFLIREPGVRDHAKILDFGFARIYTKDAHALDVTGEERIVVGTVSYMAPEQLRGKDTDHRADLYSVAALLFRMVSGQLPYETKGQSSGMVSQAAFRALRLDEPPHRLVEIDPELAGLEALEAVMHRALSTEPEPRPESAGQMRRQLAEAMGATALPPEASEPGGDAGVWRRPASGLHDLGRLQRASAEMAPAEPAPQPETESGNTTPWAAVLGGGAAVLAALGYFVWRALR